MRFFKNVADGAVNLITGDTWPKRRKVIYVTLMFCALVIAYCLGAAIVFAYVFGSIADDFNKRKHKTEEAKAEVTDA